MEYTMTNPCDLCPFLASMHGWTLKQLENHARGEFACHKTCTLSEDLSEYVPNETSVHCAGALIFLEKRQKPHQMMRICERIGKYDRTKLNMEAPVR